MPSYSTTQLVESLDDGRFIVDLTRELGRVTREVIAAQSAGQVIITLNVVSAENDSADIAPVLRSKISDASRRPRRTWVDKFGRFSDENPWQGSLINAELPTPHISKPAG